MPNLLLPAASPDALAAATRRARLRRLMARAIILNASDSAAMVSAPTVTGIGDTVTAGLTQGFGVTTNAALFTLHGGVAVVYGGAYWRLAAATRTANGNVTATKDATAGRVAFRTDALSFDIAVVATLASSRYRLLIDGQYTDKAGYAPAVNAGSYGTTRFNVALAAGSPRKLRRIDVEFEKDMGFRGIQVAPGDTVQPVAVADRYRIALIGDSVSAGTGATRVGDGYAFHAGRRLGGVELDLVSMSEGGTGYTTVVGNPGALKFGDRLDDLLAYGAGGVDEVWFAGGANDQGSAAADVTTAALACFQGARARLPAAPVIVLGGFLGASNSAAAVTTETAVKAAFDAWHDPASAFVPFNLATPKLQTGTSAAPTTGNYQYYLNGGDGTHPIDAGHDYIGSYVAEARRAIEL